MDRKLKCLFSHINSSFRHGMTIIHIPDTHCGKVLSCAGTRITSGRQGGSAYPSDTLRGSHDHANQSSASERPASSSSRRVKTTKNAAPEESGEDSPPELQSLQSGHEEILSKHCFFPNRCNLTPEQEEGLAELVKKIQPEFPVLVTRMKKSNVKGPGASLVISKGYAEEHFPAKSENITLERPGRKKWRVRLHVRPDGRGYLLSGHWADFVRDIHLKPNDVCIFQPIKGNEFRVMVHLLDEGCSHSMRGTNRSNKRRTRKVTPTVHAQEKSGRRGKSPSLDHHGRHGPRVSLDCGQPSQPPSYVVLGSTKLTPAQEKMVEEKVQAIGTEVPIFVATITEKIAGDNGSYSLDFNTQYAAPYLPSGKQRLTMYQAEWSKAWHVMLRDRQMLPGGFRQFADDNLLWTEDLCLFEPMDNGEVAMMVHIIRSEQYH